MALSSWLCVFVCTYAVNYDVFWESGDLLAFGRFQPRSAVYLSVGG